MWDMKEGQWQAVQVGAMLVVLGGGGGYPSRDDLPEQRRREGDELRGVLEVVVGASGHAEGREVVMLVLVIFQKHYPSGRLLRDMHTNEYLISHLLVHVYGSRVCQDMRQGNFEEAIVFRGNWDCNPGLYLGAVQLSWVVGAAVDRVVPQALT